MRTIQTALILVVGALTGITPRSVSGAETWLEMQGPHFTAVSNAGEGSTRNMLWQFEQIRSAMAALWPWMKTDLPKPVLVIGAKDESTVRLLAPEYWGIEAVRACLAVAMLPFGGTGVPKDETRAVATLQQLCDGGLLEACAQWAVIVASGPKPDIPKARQLLTKSCEGSLAPACEMLKSLPK